MKKNLKFLILVLACIAVASVIVFVYFNINTSLYDMKFGQLSVLGDLIDDGSIPPDSLLFVGTYCMKDGSLVAGQCIFGGEQIRMCSNSNNVQITCSGAQNVFDDVYINDLKQKQSLSPITIQSLTRVTSSDGSVVESVIVPKDLFSFIVQNDGKNIQLEGGTFQYWLRLKSSSKDIPLLANGNVEINVNGKSEKISVSADGKTDGSGVVVLRLDTPSGTFLKKINDLVSAQGTQSMTVTVLDLNVVSDRNVFNLDNPLQIYSTSFIRDSNRSVIQNEKGENVIMSPKDDRLVIQSIFTIVDVYGHDTYNRSNTHYVTKFHPAPALNPIKIFRNGELIHAVDSIDGSTVPNFSWILDTEGKTFVINRESWETISSPIKAFDGLITRDASYRIEIGSEVITFTTPLTQNNYVISCYETLQVYNLVDYDKRIYKLDLQATDKKPKCELNLIQQGYQFLDYERLLGINI